MAFKESVVKVVPKVNYKSVEAELKRAKFSSYSGYRKDKHIAVTTANSEEVILYDLSSCSINLYCNYLKIIRSRSS